ncbi:MAG TPA: hypothetical protein VGB63_03780 [Pedobacter sp.]|jgi:hypothetical protein
MKPYILFALIVFSRTWSSAQTTTQSTSTLDTTESAKTSLRLGALYSSNVSYYGQTGAERLPYTVGYSQLFLKNGLYFTAQSYKLLNSEPGISGAGLTAGYSFDLSKNLSGTLSYGRSFFPDSSRLFQSVNQDITSASLTYDWKWLTTALDADYALGSESAFYSKFTLSKYIDPGLSFSSKDYFTLEPSIEIIGGTQRFLPSNDIEKDDDSPSETPLLPTLSSNGISKGDKKPNPGRVVTDIGEKVKVRGRGVGRKVAEMPSKDDQNSTTVTTAPFGLLAYSFNLPLAYNRANYTLELAYQGIVPSKSSGNSQKLQSFFNLGFNYTF